MYLIKNVYWEDLRGFVLKVNKELEEQGGVYYRYCDDMFFIINESASEFVKTTDKLVTDAIEDLNIEINHDKTERRHPETCQ
jgi:RNA-directed DNA polymerase